MAIVSEAVIKVKVTDDTENNVQIEFDGGGVPIDAIIASLEIIVEKLKQSPLSQDRHTLN